MITDVSAAAYQVALDQPEADGTLVWRNTTVVAVRVHAGDVTGLGWTFGASAAADVVRDQLGPALVGVDPIDVPVCWTAMRREARNALVPGLVMSAISAVDVAVWDLKAKVLGVPLVRLLGRAHHSAPVYGSGGFTSFSDDELRAQLGGWVHDEGIPKVKMKIGGSTEERDVHRMALARRTIGTDTDLFVDANGAFTAKQAMRIARRASDAGVSWFEEPVPSDDLDGLALVRQVIHADVAAGEYGTDPTYFRRMCSARAVDCLQADATRCGGLTGFLRAAAIAETFQLDVSTHTAPQLHSAVSCAVPNLRHLEWFADHVRAEEILFSGCSRPVDGLLTPQTELPGHGLALRAGTAEDLRVA